MTENYQNQYTYGNGGQGDSGSYPPPVQEEDKTAYGIASLALGIVSLLLFCMCVNWITGILAIIFGIVQIVKYREKGMAVAGIITAGISLVLSVALYIFIMVGLSAAGMSVNQLYDSYYYDDSYDDSYDNYDYYDNYDSYDSYDSYDYYDGYDYDDGGESGQEFL